MSFCVRDGDEAEALAAASVRDAREAELLDEGHRAQHMLDVVEVDVLAIGGHHDVLGPADEAQPALVVELAHVAGVQPALGIDDLCRGVVVAKVAGHDVGTPGKDLPDAVVVWVEDLDLHTGNGLAHCAGLSAAWLGHRHGEHGARLGEAVAFRQVQPEAGEQLLGVLGKGSASADEDPDVAAKAAVDPPEEEAPKVEASGLADGPVEVHGLVEGKLDQGTLALHLVADPTLEDLPQRGHTDHAGDAAFLEAVAQAVCGELVEVVDAGAHGQGQQQAAGELKGVVQGQHAEQAVVLREREQRPEAGHHGTQVAMGEHDPLGVAGGTGGVEDAREGVGVEVCVWQAADSARCTGLSEILHGEVVDQLAHVLSGNRVEKSDAGAAGTQDVGQLVELHLGRDRDEHAAGTKDAEAASHPAGVVLAAQDDPVAWLETLGGQPDGDGLGLAEELLEGDALEAVLVGPEQRGCHLVAVGSLFEQLDQVVVGPEWLLLSRELCFDLGADVVLDVPGMDVDDVVSPVNVLRVPVQVLLLGVLQPGVGRSDVGTGEAVVVGGREGHELVDDGGLPFVALGHTQQRLRDGSRDGGQGPLGHGPDALAQAPEDAGGPAGGLLVVVLDVVRLGLSPGVEEVYQRVSGASLRLYFRLNRPMSSTRRLTLRGAVSELPSW